MAMRKRLMQFVQFQNRQSPPSKKNIYIYIASFWLATRSEMHKAKAHEKVAESNERVAESNERVAESNEKVAESNERFAESNENFAESKLLNPGKFLNPTVFVYHIVLYYVLLYHVILYYIICYIIISYYHAIRFMFSCVTLCYIIYIMLYYVVPCDNICYYATICSNVLNEFVLH